MTENQQESLEQIAMSPYKEGLEVRRMVEKLSGAHGQAGQQLRTRIFVLSWKVAYHYNPQQKDLFVQGYMDASKEFVAP